jgi:hypothetical protein
VFLADLIEPVKSPSSGLLHIVVQYQEDLSAVLLAD